MLAVPFQIRLRHSAQEQWPRIAMDPSHESVGAWAVRFQSSELLLTVL